MGFGGVTRYTTRGSGWSGSPSSPQNTNPVSLHAGPARDRSSSCRRRCDRSSSTVLASRAIDRCPRFVIGASHVGRDTALTRGALTNVIGLFDNNPRLTASLNAFFNARQQLATDWCDNAEPSTFPFLSGSDFSRRRFSGVRSASLIRRSPSSSVFRVDWVNSCRDLAVDSQSGFIGLGANLHSTILVPGSSMAMHSAPHRCSLRSRQVRNHPSPVRTAVSPGPCPRRELSPACRPLFLASEGSHTAHRTMPDRLPLGC